MNHFRISYEIEIWLRSDIRVKQNQPINHSNEKDIVIINKLALFYSLMALWRTSSAHLNKFLELRWHTKLVTKVCYALCPSFSFNLYTCPHSFYFSFIAFPWALWLTFLVMDHGGKKREWDGLGEKEKHPHWGRKTELIIFFLQS